MSIHLNPGYQATIQIKDKHDHLVYQKSCSSEYEVKAFIRQYGKSKYGWSLLRGTVIPLRTQYPKDFLKDLFLPTFLHFSLKINNMALKIIGSIFAVMLDITTFPIRLITTPFRIYYNYKYPDEKHPLIHLIEDQSRFQKTIENNKVNLCYEVQNVQITPFSPPDEKGNIFQDATKSTIQGVMSIALKKIPGGIKNQSSEKTENISYLAINGKWTIANFSEGSSSHYSYRC